MPREIREQENGKFINSLSSLFAQFPFASLIRRKKRLFCFTKPENFPKIFYAAKNRTYTNTPTAICASKIAGDAELEVPVPRFVVKDPHCEKSTRAAEQQRECK